MQQFVRDARQDLARICEKHHCNIAIEDGQLVIIFPEITAYSTGNLIRERAIHDLGCSAFTGNQGTLVCWSPEEEEKDYTWHMIPPNKNDS